MFPAAMIPESLHLPHWVRPLRVGVLSAFLLACLFLPGTALALEARLVLDRETIEAGEVISKIPRDTTKVQDITAPPASELALAASELPAGTLLICEGGIASAEQALQARSLGADAVVVGTAITGVDLQVAAYRRALEAF